MKISKWILEGKGSADTEKCAVAVLYEYRNKHSVFIKTKKFLDHVIDYKLFQ
jgi:hypothetical protein